MTRMLRLYAPLVQKQRIESVSQSICCYTSFQYREALIYVARSTDAACQVLTAAQLNVPAFRYVTLVSGQAE
jgi:hypothetical protein